MADKVTLDSLAGMVEKMATGVSGQLEAMGDRLTTLETAPKAKAKGNASPASPKVSIPMSEELNTLEGLCAPVAQKIVRSNYRRGREAMTAYVAKLAGFQTGDKPSPRCAYATALLKAGPKDWK